jgi:hypothetical protein
MKRARLIVLALAIAIGIARIVGTWHVFNATFDEPVHLESGIEWIQFGRLTVNQMHPPLSRELIAAGPYFHGVRWQNKADFRDEGIAELHARGDYWHTLALARMGILPFFVLAVVATWWLARGIYGPDVALAAAVSLTLLPPFLAHAGIATTDLAVASMMPVVVVLGLRWLDEPRTSTASLLGAASGAAVLLKFSALFLVPACLVAMLFLSAAISGPRPPGRRRGHGYFILTLDVILVGFLVVWAGYDLHVGTLDSIQLGGLKLGDFVSPRLASLPIVPAPEFWSGLITVAWYNRISIPTYVLGDVKPGGAWYFFPVAIGVKTPIAFLVLAVIGAGVSLSAALRRREWHFAVPLTAAAAMLALGMSSRIALGLRHLLSIYPTLAILAGVGAAFLWHLRAAQRLGRIVVVLLVMWLVIASVRAHPDYLADFNEIASSRPEHFLLVSDLDYGQDAARLADTLRARRIDSVTVYLFTFRDDSLFKSVRHVSYPNWRAGRPPPVTGWVAASSLLAQGVPGIPWLASRTPVTKVGKTIGLYWVPP